MRRFAMLLLMMVVLSAPGVGALSPPPLTRKQIMESADKNRDGKISRVEFLERMRDAFFFVDSNKDGFLTLEEYQRIPGADTKQQFPLIATETLSRMSHTWSVRGWIRHFALMPNE